MAWRVIVLVVGCVGLARGLYGALTYRSPWGPRYGWHYLDDDEVEKLKNRRTWRAVR